MAKTHKNTDGMSLLNKIASKKRKAESFFESIGKNARSKKDTYYGRVNSFSQGVANVKNAFKRAKFRPFSLEEPK